MSGVIYLDIVVGNRLSRAELCLSKSDITELFNEAMAGLCLTCGSPHGSDGVLCCVCFHKESECHADCCLPEEGEE